MKIPKHVRDPFVWLIALVVLTPASLFALAVIRQPKDNQVAVNSASQTAPPENQTAAATTSETSPTAPITQAEQAPLATAAPLPTTASPQAPTCDQVQKQTAQSSHDSLLAAENALHAKQLDRIRLISMVYRKYWDEEIARHDAAVTKIETGYQAALAAAHC